MLSLTKKVPTLVLICAIVSYGSATLIKSSISNKIQSYTVLSSDQAIKDSNILYLLCKTPEEIFSNKLKCKLIKENVNPNNISEKNECDLPLFETKEGVINPNMKVIWFGDDKAIINWKELNNPIGLKQIIVDLTNCKVTETEFVARELLRSSTEGFNEYVIYNDKFDVVYIGSDKKDKIHLNKNTFNAKGKSIARKSWIGTDVNPNSAIDVKILPIGNDGEKYLVLEKNLDKINIFIQKDLQSGKPIRKELTSIPNVERTFDDATKLSLLSSNTHNLIGYCIQTQNKVECSQYSPEEKLLFKAVLPFNYRMYDRAMMNLPKGGMLLLTTKCPEEITQSLRCEKPDGSEHEITKIDSNGKKVGHVKMDRFKCDLNNNVVRAKFFEKDGGYCITLMCHFKEPTTYDSELKATAACFSDKDFKM